jgi:hypothetical protein
MREIVTTLLDVIGLFLVAFGVGAALYPVIGPGSTITAGAVVLAGSTWAARGGDK